MSVYAAIVATAALVWQVITWRRGQSTVADVSLSVGWVNEPSARQASVHVRITNRSDHQITIEQVSIEGTSAAGVPGVVAIGNWGERKIGAHDGYGFSTFLADDGVVLDWARPVKARVLLANGEWCASSVTSAP